jgi:DNA-binding CsgD family transcriptional regulator
MMLVGRDEEMATLHALFLESARGRAVVAVVRGPVACGKTAVLQALAGRAADSGAACLGAIASRAERGLPLGVLDQLCRGSQLPAEAGSQLAALLDRDAIAGLPPSPAPEAIGPALARVFEGMLAVLVRLAQDRPVLLAVDDAQHADVMSLQFLSYLARRAGTARILTVLAESPQTRRADALVHAELLRQGNCHVIPLAPLPEPDLARLLAGYVGDEASQRLASACHRMTGGNPLLAKALGQDDLAADPSRPAGEALARLVPGPAFRSAVLTCLHRHEPELAKLAQAVAVLGGDVTLALLGDLLEIEPDSAARGLDLLATSGLLEPGGFRHEEARQAVLGHMTIDERADLQGRAAAALYRAGAAPAAVAGHLVAAELGGDGWTVPVLQEAAEQVLADGDAARAVGYLRRAKSECSDERQRAAIGFSLACAEWLVNPERGARHLSGLVADARSGLLSGEHLGELAYYLIWAGDQENAEEVLATLDLGPADPPLAPRMPVRQPAFRSPMEFLYPDLARRSQRTRGDARTSAAAARTPAPGGRTPTAEAAGPRSAPQTKPPGAVADNTKAAIRNAEIVLSERSVNDPTLASVTTALMTLICEDRLDRASFWCDVLLRESGASAASPSWRAVLTAILAMIEMRRGNLPVAERHARTALSLLTKRAWGVAIGVPLSSLLLTATASRKHDEAAACLRMPVPEAMFSTFYGLLYLYARGEYYLASERPQAALTDFTDCGKRMATWGLDLPGLLPWRTKAAEAHLVMGNSLQARELSKEQLAQAGARFPRTRGISLRALALTSHPTKRTALLRESAEALRDSGARLELAYTFNELSNAHLALGEHGRAQWAARQARNLAEQCGATAQKTAIGVAEAAGESDGETSGDVDKKLISQLSDAEQRVGALAAFGYTNGQIAHKLYITVSTVEQHLTRIYRKLGVTGRAELPIDVWRSPSLE